MSKFTIYAGRAFKADFTIISSDGSTGEPIVTGDAVLFSIITSGETPTCVLDGIPMVPQDTENGVWTLSLTDTQTSELKQYLGWQEDGFNPISNYMGFLDMSLSVGDRQATVDVSVVETPQCQQ